MRNCLTLHWCMPILFIIVDMVSVTVPNAQIEFHCVTERTSRYARINWVIIRSVTGIEDLMSNGLAAVATLDEQLGRLMCLRGVVLEQQTIAMSDSVAERLTTVGRDRVYQRTLEDGHRQAMLAKNTDASSSHGPPPSPLWNLRANDSFWRRL